MNRSIRRLSSAAVLSVLCACTAGAGLAWACAPSSWGFSAPSTPESTPTPGSGSAAPTPAPESAPSGTSGSLAPAEASPSEPAQTPSRQPAKSPVRAPASSPGNTPSSGGSRGFVPRSTLGGAQSRSGTQSSGTVASSRPARSSRAGDTARGKSKKGKKAARASASSRSTNAVLQAATVGDLWSGFEGKSASLMPSTSDPASPSANAGSQLGVGAGLLGLGLVGLFGGLAVAGARRRRAPARG